MVGRLRLREGGGKQCVRAGAASAGAERARAAASAAVSAAVSAHKAKALTGKGGGLLFWCFDTQTRNKVHPIISIHADRLSVTVYTVYHDLRGDATPLSFPPSKRGKSGSKPRKMAIFSPSQFSSICKFKRRSCRWRGSRDKEKALDYPVKWR